MARELNDLMQMDHVICVHPDGSVTDADGEWAPEPLMESADEYQIMPEHEKDYARQVEHEGWSLMYGYSGQQAAALTATSCIRARFVG